MHIAQTNLQLFRQAREAGYSRSEILDLRRDFGVSYLLHGHLGRFSGRPFVCHLVGTASLLLHEDKPVEMVRAAVNHAAYDVGRFPTGARGARRDHRRWLQRKVGADVERLIFDYAQHPGAQQDFAAVAAAPDSDLTGAKRVVFAMHVCNEVDDGWCHAAVLEGLPKWRDPDYFTSLLTVAQRLGLAHCERALRQIAQEMADGDWLTPEERFAFMAHRQSLLRYLKGTVMSMRYKLQGRADEVNGIYLG